MKNGWDDRIRVCSCGGTVAPGHWRRSRLGKYGLWDIPLRSVIRQEETGSSKFGIKRRGTKVSVTCILLINEEMTVIMANIV